MKGRLSDPNQLNYVHIYTEQTERKFYVVRRRRGLMHSDLALCNSAR